MPAKPLNQLSGMPQVGNVLNGWTVKITLQVLTQTIVDGFPVDTPRSVTFDGTVQPFSPQQLKLIPEGQRAWQWLQIHCKTGPNTLELSPGDKIVYNGTRYKVMAQNDYSLNGYIEYHLIQDFGTVQNG